MKGLQETKSEIAGLILKYHQGLMSDQEGILLDQWRNESAENRSFFDELSNNEYLLQEYIDRHKLYETVNEKDAWRVLLSRGVVQQSKVSWLSGSRKYSVAATLLISLTIAGYILLNKPPKSSTSTTKVTANSNSFSHSKATLTLSDGRTIELDSTTPKTFKQDGISIENKNGQLIYADAAPGQNAIYNTLSTTKGQMYATTLSDGSRIVVSSMSSIKYPIIFDAKERHLELTGEAYFEVKHDSKRPFRVSVNGTTIEVLGTSFNIKAFDTSQTRATLLEGGIKIIPFPSGVKMSKILKPGEQADVINKTVSIKHDADIEQAIAWKNRMFVFKSTEITEIMNEIRRWYDVDIQYLSNVNGLKLSGQISRYSDVSKVLEMLGLMQKIQFRLNGRTIVVSKNEAY